MSYVVAGLLQGRYEQESGQGWPKGSHTAYVPVRLSSPPMQTSLPLKRLLWFRRPFCIHAMMDKPDKYVNPERTTVPAGGGGETVFPNVQVENDERDATWSECARKGLAVKA
eukprot:scaffold675563_cov57-Prasinocladus_malaysianus.AAC.1